MRPQGPTFFLLSGSPEQWRTADRMNLNLGDMTGLTLAGRADGPFALTSEDGSLGRVALPRGAAVDEQGSIYLLGQTAAGVKRFDPDTCNFELLPGIGDEFGREVGQFYEQFKDPSKPVPSNIAVTQQNLYVADRGNHRVQVFALRTLSIRHVWGPRDAKGRRTSAGNKRAWAPVDVAAAAGRAYILDARYRRVFMHCVGKDRLKLFIQGAEDRNWTRIAIDKAGRIYLLNSAGPETLVEIYDNEGRLIETKSKAGDIRDRFETPAVQLRRLDPNDPWNFALPEDLKELCAKCAGENRRLAYDPCKQPSVAPGCASESSEELAFDREGKRWRKRSPGLVGPKFLEEQGEWRSKALDSQVYRCQWHRIELDLYQLPPGTRVELYTYSDTDNLSKVEASARLDALGKLAYKVAGELPPPLKPPKTDQSCTQSKATVAEEYDSGTCASVISTNRHEFLVQSREGQFMYLKLVLFGDGYDTPAVRSLRVHYPRSSYLEYLPAVYSSDDESRWFLERFLSIFQTDWDGIERCIGDVAALFDPKAVPGGKALDYLASWFALPLEGTWDAEKKRTLLKAIARIYFGSWKVTSDEIVCLTETNTSTAARRGTRDGLRRYLQVYLQNITGLKAEEQGAFPQIDEGFRERQRLMLALGDTSSLSRCSPLWSPGVVGRLHIGEYARTGEARLVSTGDPEHEIFQEYAHRFRVFVPSSWIQTATDEEMVHRALREEKPAHTSYDLCLVEPRFRVGLQSTVGIDTILGAWPTARLACTHDKDIPPSRLPRHCLGLDTILAAPPGDFPTMQVGPGTRAGIDTILN